MDFTDEAAGWLARRGFQPEFGARPLRRTIQREVGSRLSALLPGGRLTPGQHVTAIPASRPPAAAAHGQASRQGRLPSVG